MGGSQDTYVRHMLIRARNKEWSVVVFNSRGCADSPVSTPQFYSASFTGDMREVIRHVSTWYPKANIYAVGWSLGANILARYLGEYIHLFTVWFREFTAYAMFQESQSCPLSGAVSLYNPFNLVIPDEDFRKGFNNVYDKALTNELRGIFKRHLLLFEDVGGEYNIPLAAKARIGKDFDEALTRVMRITSIPMPILLWAANDPIAPSRDIPRDDIKVHSSEFI